MLNNLHCGITDLVSGQKLVELCEVAVRLEDIQQVQSKINAFLVVIAQSSRYCAKQCLVIKHVLHILVTETKVEQRHGTLRLYLHTFVIEHFKISIEIFDSHLVEVNSDLLWPFALESLLMRLHCSYAS